MRKAWVGLAGVSALALTVTGVAAAAEEGSVSKCAKTRIFEIGGHDDGHAKVYDKSNKNLPEGVDFQKIHYSAQGAPFPGDTISLDDSIAEGTVKLTKAVRDYNERCPESHITVSGYSMGAVAAGDVLNKLSREQTIPHHQVDGVLYADPRRPGVEGGPGGVMTNLPTVIPGVTMRGPRGFGDIAVHEICNKNDGTCFSENPLTNLLGFANGAVGSVLGDHTDYDFDPVSQRGDGDTVNDQPPRIPHLPSPHDSGKTPYERYDGSPEAKRVVSGFIRGILKYLPAEARELLGRSPWFTTPRK